MKVEGPNNFYEILLKFIEFSIKGSMYKIRPLVIEKTQPSRMLEDIERQAFRDVKERNWVN